MQSGKGLVPKLDKPVWFDTGFKMQDGVTPITVAAYNHGQLAEYLEKKSVLGTDKDGHDICVLWKKLTPGDVSASEPEAVPGVTMTRKRAVQ